MNCGNCLYWLKDSQPQVGTCRRFPPIVLPVPGMPLGTCWWPATNEEKWCGEWVEMPQAQAVPVPMPAGEDEA